MNILEIIRQEAPRTEDQLRFAHEILFQQQKLTKDFPFSIDLMNEILDDHILISKSRLLSCLGWCPFQYKCKKICRLPQGQVQQITDIGSNLHLNNKKFWTNFPVNGLLHTANVTGFIHDRYTSTLPSELLSDSDIQYFVNEFICFESQRIHELFGQLGRTRKTIKEYVIPVAVELPVENWDLWIDGIIDRIDRLSNGAYAVVEYKYGKPKDFEKQPDHHAISVELAFYNCLIQGKQVYVVNEDNSVTPINEYLGIDHLQFYYGAMVFFQNVEFSRKLFKISKLMIRSAMDVMNKFWIMLQSGKFPIIPRESCYSWCDYYWNFCEFNEEFLNIDRVMDD